MATGTDFQTAFRQAIPDSIAYIDRLLDGEMGLTTAGSDTLLALPVTQVIQERLFRSIGLLTVSLLFASLVGITLGILAARSRSERSLAVLIASIIGISMPSFFAAFLLQWFVISLTLQAGRTTLPVGGFGWDAHLILPMLVLAMRPIAQITRMTFVSIREILSQDYIRTAYSKGLHRYQIMTAHVMRNAAFPILATVGISLRFSLCSLPAVELYFGWLGAGFTMLKGIAQQDVNLVISLALCFAIFFILVNTFLDLIFRLIDPRLLKKPDHIASTERQNIFETIQNTWATVVANQ
jgi:ABC-type dipeptide/oligopeptide/nickel transport system permease component